MCWMSFILTLMERQEEAFALWQEEMGVGYCCHGIVLPIAPIWNIEIYR